MIIDAAREVQQFKNLDATDHLGDGFFYVQHAGETFAIPSEDLCFTIALESTVFLQSETITARAVVRRFSMMEALAKTLFREPFSEALRVTTMSNIATIIHTRIQHLFTCTPLGLPEDETLNLARAWDDSAAVFKGILQRTNHPDLGRRMLELWAIRSIQACDFNQCFYLHCTICNSPVIPVLNPNKMELLMKHLSEQHWANLTPPKFLVEPPSEHGMTELKFFPKVDPA